MISALMKHPMRLSLLAATALGSALTAQPVWAKGRRPPAPVVPQYSGWIVYWDAESGKGAARSWKDLEEISLFAYQFDPSGKLVPATSDVQGMKDWAKENRSSKRQRILMTVVNDAETGSGTLQKDAACVHKAIGTPEARAVHIQELVSLAEGVDGIDIDYERLSLDDREAFSTFIKELGETLHHRHKWLSVILQPRTAQTADNDSSGAGVFDWAAIAPYADRIKVMAYLYHYSGSEPGSIAPVSWISPLTDYALTVVPPHKLGVALHLGGFDWPDMSPGRSLEFAQAKTLADAHHQKIQTDEQTQSGYFQYVDDHNVPHSVWIENASGLKAKVQALGNQGVPYVSFWRLGAGDPALPETLFKR
jgi:spore germination protein YaaH